MNVASGSIVNSPGDGPAPIAHARASIVRFTAAAFATRPRSEPPKNRHNVDVDGSTWPPRSRLVASPAISERSDTKSPPAN